MADDFPYTDEEIFGDMASSGEPRWVEPGTAFKIDRTRYNEPDGYQLAEYVTLNARLHILISKQMLLEAQQAPESYMLEVVKELDESLRLIEAFWQTLKIDPNATPIP